MTDERLHRDAELLQGLLEGRIEPDDARLRELYQRRPDWRALQTSGEERDWQAEASEDDRRQVAELLAEARVGMRPRLERAPAPRRRPRLLAVALTLAAAAVLLFLARAWLAPARPSGSPGGLLGSSEGLDFVHPGETTPDFDYFEWTWKDDLEPKGCFVLTVWALGEDGVPGAKRFERETRLKRIDIPAEERATWPDRIRWRVEVLDSNRIPGANRERSAQRSPH